MAKKVGVPILKKKPMKRDNKKKQFLDKILQYLKSDNYMFASLISENPSNTFSPDPSGVLGNVATKGESEVVETSVEDYVASDCYMYAPLIVSQPWLEASKSVYGPSGPPKDTRQPTELMKKLSEDRLREKEKIIREDKLLSASPRKNNIAVTRKITKKETVKQILQSPSEPGKAPARTRGRRTVSGSKK